jgi:hypothetical protein
MKRFLILLLLLSFFGTKRGLIAQASIWNTLGMVTYESKYDESTFVEIKKPKISSTVEKVDGTVIIVEGFIIPLSGQVTQSHFMLSKFPQATCFFCGKAGPETAMQVFMKDNKKIKITERKVKVTGTLYVNPKDANSLLYTLENATIIE